MFILDDGGNTPSGPSCFSVPRWRPDGTPNGFFLQRLKDKCGNRSNASARRAPLVELSEVTYTLDNASVSGIRNPNPGLSV
jgi:hypothetical protein